MCGRFALYASESEIKLHFHLQQGFSMRSKYNIPPDQMIPVICEWGTRIEFCRWGFIPSWAKGSLNQRGHINARSETILEKPTFKSAFKNRRCLIPASGYYEWRALRDYKQPYYIYLKNKPLFAFAGIWSIWQCEKGQSHYTCAIITSNASEQLQPVHDRMPVIVNPENYIKWLSNKTAENDLKTMLFSQMDAQIGCHAVSKRVGDPRFDNLSCIHALSDVGL